MSIDDSIWDISDEEIPIPGSTVPKDMQDVSLGESDCDICFRSFKNVRGLNRHRTMTHGADRPSKSPSEARKKKRTTKDLEQSLEVLLSSLALATMLANQADGLAVQNGAPGLASALANCAERNPKMRAFLENLTSGFAYSELVAASAVIIVPILANHGMLPERFAMAAAYLSVKNQGVPDSAFEA